VLAVGPAVHKAEVKIVVVLVVPKVEHNKVVAVAVAALAVVADQAVAAVSADQVVEDNLLIS
jgi:hypothetical protein